MLSVQENPRSLKNLWSLVVLPNISNEADRARAQDELPQSAAGKTIMTTEPKFVPNQAMSVHVSDGLDVNIRLVDCVGYTVPGAKGYEDENGPRMINTPWYEEPIPFHEAAEIGTRKVIQEHSTIGVVITTDGTIGDIARSDYIEAEERVIEEPERGWQTFYYGHQLSQAVSPGNGSHAPGFKRKI